MAVGEAGKRRRKAVIGLAAAGLTALPFAYSAVVVPLSPWEQAEVSLALIGLAILASLSQAAAPADHVPVPASLRALLLLARHVNPEHRRRSLDASSRSLLLAAETYGLAGLFLGYFQTIELRERRRPAPHPHRPAWTSSSPPTTSRWRSCGAR